MISKPFKNSILKKFSKIGLFFIFVGFLFIPNILLPSFAKEIIFVDPDIADQIPDWVNDIVDISTEKPSILDSSSDNEDDSRPTFGLDHENKKKIVDSGFKLNNQTYSIEDNFYTPFEEKNLNIGEPSIFAAKVYASKGLMVQEFLFSIPSVGKANMAEVGVEVWFDYQGKIKQTKVIQKDNVVNETSLVTTHEKTKCTSSDYEEKCDFITISLEFLEPLRDKIMALKAIDFKRRYQITYLNEGISISGNSLNPMKSEKIPSGLKGGGLIEVTQISKYSSYWISEEGRMFEKNSFGSFKEIGIDFKRFHDSGDVKTRKHSEFGVLLEYEKKRAEKKFDGSKLYSKLPEAFHYDIKIKERLSEDFKTQMKLQEQLAQNFLKESNKQTRY